MTTTNYGTHEPTLAPGATHHGDQPHHVVPLRVYLSVFIALLVLTAITVGVAELDLGRMNDVVALGVAFLKATLVVLFFMHVRYNSRLIALTVTGALLWLAILFAHTLSDYLTRHWL